MRLNDRVRRFFTADVGARQPAGDPRRQAAVRRAGHQRVRSLAGRRARSTARRAFLRRGARVLIRVEAQWQQLVGQVLHVDAPGDSFAHLLNILGLQATSVRLQRRRAYTRSFLWNLAHLTIGGNFGPAIHRSEVRYFQRLDARHPAAQRSRISVPRTAEDVRPAVLRPADAPERPADRRRRARRGRSWSERDALPAKYTVPASGNSIESGGSPRTGTTSAGSSAARSTTLKQRASSATRQDRPCRRRAHCSTGCSTARCCSRTTTRR